MAEVAEMGEVDEMHSNEEGVILNGDVSKDIDMDIKEETLDTKGTVESKDDSMDSKESIDGSIDDDKEDSMDDKDESMDSKEDSMDGKQENIESKVESIGETKKAVNGKDSKEEHTENKDSKDLDVDNRDEDMDSKDSSMDEDCSSQDSQELKSQSSQESQDHDSNMGSEPANEENMEDGDTNSSLPKTEEENTEDSNISNQKNDEDSKSSKTEPKVKPPDSLEMLKENEERAASVASSADDIHEIHEIDDDDKSEKSKNHETIELNSEDDGDVMFVDSPKTNGTATEVIDLVETPEKKEIPEKKKVTITPRRSSRNINKNKSYVESDKEDTPPPKSPEKKAEDEVESEESDIEEVLPQDPLAVNDQITVERIPSKKEPPNQTIVVKDTKRLVEIASKSNTTPTHTPGVKKEPTLVIIDTNSILSGRGAVPMTKPPPSIPTSSYTPILPVAVPAQGMYPANMRATITPIPVNSTSTLMTHKPTIATITPTAPLLPTLTDDMFVVEAPSFIVPYVYEKPPVKVLKEFVTDIKKQIQDTKKEKRDKREEEKKEKEKEAEVKKEKEDDKDEDEDKGKEEVDKKKKGGEDSDASYSTESDDDEEEKDPKKPYSYFDSPLGKFFINIGFNMVQEYVQSDLLKQQKRKRDREQGANPETNKTINQLMKNLEFSKENNEHFRMATKKCEFCNFKTESALAMSYHLETPHMKNFVYKCNFCAYEVRSPHDILFHMEAEHAVRGHLERAPAFHQCPSCPFEDNQKGKLSRHLVVCARKFKPDKNLEPPADWEPPAKIPRVPKMRATGLNATVAAYQTLNKQGQYQFLSKMQLQASANSVMQRGRGRPTLGPNMKAQPILRPQGMVFKQQTMSGGSVLVPTNYQLSGNQVFQVVGGQDLGGRLGTAPGHMAFVPSMPSSAAQAAMQTAVQPKKPSNTPSISITPLPRGTTATPTVTSKPGDTNSKNSFVICEICDGYIKDLEQLRNHMQWIHKIKIHPKMIYNRPPLNCQKCQFRFFTDQGLERHLLGSHGLVTSSMQDAANKSKDSGRCPVCGRVYQWKLLNHVARDHNMTLKPAHLSYKCTVCTATFGMYKQFENHVYSAHSVVAKRVMDKKATSSASSPSTVAKSTDMKPLKINDEITIIPQPAKSTNGASKEGSPSSTGSTNSKNSAPGTSKSTDGETPSTSRADRLARRNATDSD